MMKFRSSLVLFFIILILIFTHTSAKPKIVTTIYPFKVILQEITGNSVDVINIVPSGASPHSFDLSPKILADVEKSIALIYGADELDGWVTKIEHKNKIKLIELISEDSLITIDSYSISGKKKQHGIDPHFWTDPLIVKSVLPAIVDKLCSLDPSNCDSYKLNSKKFSDKLDNLHDHIENESKTLKKKEVILSHPFFQYYLKRYKINVEGIIEPLPEREPTPKELQSIIELGQKNNVDLIINNLQHPGTSANLVSEATGIPVLILDPIGGTGQLNSYEKIILNNTELLMDALK